MAITEDYVSFETAKLLKDKGFNESCYTYYDNDGSINRFDEGHHFNNTSYPWGVPYDFSKTKKYVVTPTLQRAMKWLREVHNLSIEVYRTACGYIGCIVAIPSGTDIKVLEENGDDLPSGQYTKWEYACEEAIKYYLENLI